jgi:hypothetical protein
MATTPVATTPVTTAPVTTSPARTTTDSGKRDIRQLNFFHFP